MGKRTSLRNVLLVAKGLHQIIARFCVLSESEASFLGTFGPAKIGERGCYDVEGDAVGTSAERLEHLLHFDIASGPSLSNQ